MTDKTENQVAFGFLMFGLVCGIGFFITGTKVNHLHDTINGLSDTINGIEANMLSEGQDG